MFKVNNKDSNFIVNFEHISHLVLVFLLLTLNMQLPAGKQNLAKISKATQISAVWGSTIRN